MNNQVRILDDDSLPRYMHYAEDFITYKFPEGTRVLYPKPPMAAIKNRRAAIRQALNNPEGGVEPLHTQLKAGMKVTIAVDDISVPLPPMKRPDLRQDMLEIIVEQLVENGVEDFEIVVALALHRRMSEAEIRRMVGDKIFDAYYPKKLYNMDAEDPDALVVLGQTDQNEDVQILKRAADSDLLIYVNINFVPMNGGFKSIGTGLAGYKGIKHHHNPETILKCKSYMDPKNSALYSSNERMGRFINETINVFHIETTLNNKMYDDSMMFLARAEDDWSPSDHMKFRSMQWALSKLPRKGKRALFHKIPADYGLIGVHAGPTEAVHEKTLEKCWQQHAVKIKGQADVLVYGIPFASPYNVNSILNPILVQVMALGYFFNMYRGMPVVKKDGTLIITHPCYDEFDPEHHPSYVEFFNRCLSQTNRTCELRKWEEEFATNPNYVEMFRRGNAYHGVHPFYMWYWGENGRDHIGNVIVVGAENDHVPARLGWLTAKTMDEALEMARDFHGPNPDITMMHHPPFMVADVE